MSVNSVLNAFITAIRKNYDLEIFNIDVSPDEAPSFDPKTPMEQVCSSIRVARTNINNAFSYLYNDLEIANGEHQNFITINALSEVFRDTPQYSLKAKTFTNRLEYSYTCGQLYYSYAKGCQGDFLDSLYDYVPVNIAEICNTYQALYNKFVPTSSSTPGEPAELKITQFWNKYGSKFSKEILAYNSLFETLATDFLSFYNMITEYKNLAINASKIQATGFVFVGAQRREQSILENMDQVFNDCRNKFKYYDSVVDNLYELWLTTVEHVETEYTEENEYEKESLKTKIFSALLLDSVKFYDNSKKIYGKFLTFFKQYGIK